MTDVSKSVQSDEEKILSRRKALAKLGLTVGITAYVAPLLTKLNEAHADQGCPPGEHRSMGTCVR